MSDLLVAALLGIVQGVTEFLPISSTAHLIVAEKVFKLDPDRFGLAFDVALHMGTLVAVLLYFTTTWWAVARDLLAGRWRVPALLAVGTVPAVVAGLLIQSLVERELRDIRIIAATLAGVSLLFYLAERRAARGIPRERVGWTDAIVMGLAQATALVPGVSRSGITITGGLVRGLARHEATRFSFLLSTPVIAGAGAKTLLDAGRTAELFARPEVTLTGFAFSFAAGIASVAFLMRFLRGHSLNWFIPYRLLLAAVLVVAALLGVA